MLSNVPQFIDIEDRIVGPLTFKQIGWLALGGVILIVVWNLLEFSAFIIVAFIIAAIFSALAFYKPYNQPLITFIMYSFVYLFRPKLYVWRKDVGFVLKVQPKKPRRETGPKRTKKISSEKIESISRTLDFNKPK